ncbi:uncharacterized protein LOC116263950 [Nymphaea colorata]|nr:uncharacterized protein LOC116263950 [Nymphaea colorata]
MADKASRALVIYGDGLMPFLSRQHTNIHKLASLGCCGFLALRNAPLGENEDVKVARELAQLLDVPCAYNTGEHDHTDASAIFQKSCMPMISERFMGMKAAFCTDCSIAKSFGKDAGFTVTNVHELMEGNVTSGHLDQDKLDTPILASRLLKLLGLQYGDVVETNENDLVLVHVEASTESFAANELEFVNLLVGEIIEIAQNAPKISSRLHLSLVLSYGSVPENESRSFLTLSPEKDDGNLSMLYPHQSYTMKEGKILNGIRHHHPMLIAQWQEAVTRRDMAQVFEFEEFKKHGGNLAILAERFIHEVAFKLWKAPKYGA